MSEPSTVEETLTGQATSVQGLQEAVEEDKGRGKQARFKRLAGARTNKALNAIRLIGNLTGTNYESTQEQREYIEEALNNAVEEMGLKLSRTVEKENSSFTL